MKLKTLKGKIIFNSKGNIKKFLTKNSAEFNSFGECYFSEIKKNVIKGWKKNITTNQMISVIYGKVIFFLIDDTGKRIKKYKFTLDDNKNYKKIIIPKNICYAFKGLHKKKSILFNFLSIEHKKTKILNKKFGDL